MDSALKNTINNMCKFLAKRDIPALNSQNIYGFCKTKKADVLYLPDCDLLSHMETAANAFSRGLCSFILLSGGVGHSTQTMRQSAQNIFGLHSCENLSEGEIMAKIFSEIYGITKDALIVEKNSSNCGENAAFSKKLLEDMNLHIKTMIVIHDPLMQTRTDATLRKHMPRVQFINFAPFIPQIDEEGNITPKLPDIWKKPRFFELLLGEMRRINDDEKGYTPCGKGFTSYIPLPQNFHEDFDFLQKNLSSFCGRV